MEDLTKEKKKNHCAAYNCQNKHRTKDISFHRFPHKHPNLLKQWIFKLRWKDWTPCRTTLLCSAHFEDQCFQPGLITQRLKPGAVPTIFDFPGKKKAAINPRSRRALKPVVEPIATLLENERKRRTVKLPWKPEPSIIKKPRPRAEQVPWEPDPVTRPRRRFPWTIQGDAALMKLMTIPSFFHGLYCLPQSFRWAGDDDFNIKPHVVPEMLTLGPPHVIEVTERWQWLGLDVRGPLTTTRNGHQYILTFTDYHSKWVEAFPLNVKFDEGVADNLSEIIEQFGYPLGVLSRLSIGYIANINFALRERGKVKEYHPLVIHHRQTGYLDLATESLLNTMVSELVREHPDSWHVHLPAAVLRLCCTDHPTTGERPFTRMLGKEPPPDNSPRELPFSAKDIQTSSFVIQATRDKVQVQEDIDSLWKGSVGSEETGGGNDVERLLSQLTT